MQIVCKSTYSHYEEDKSIYDFRYAAKKDRWNIPGKASGYFWKKAAILFDALRVNAD